MVGAYERMVQDFRDVQQMGVTKANALFIANSAGAALILKSDLVEQQRQDLVALARAGSAYEAAVNSPHKPAYKARLEEALAEFLSR